MGTLQKRREKLANKDYVAQEAILEDLFHDLYRNRGRIYKINFIRGIFFGLGSILGGTIVIALLIALLSLLVQAPGGIGDFITWIIETIKNR